MNGKEMAETTPVVKKSSKKRERKKLKELLIMGPEIKVNGKSVAGGIHTASMVSRLPDIPSLADYCRELHSAILARVFETPIGEGKSQRLPSVEDL